MQPSSFNVSVLGFALQFQPFSSRCVYTYVVIRMHCLLNACSPDTNKAVWGPFTAILVSPARMKHDYASLNTA